MVKPTNNQIKVIGTTADFTRGVSDLKPAEAAMK